jgi:hypothetical protein
MSSVLAKLRRAVLPVVKHRAPRCMVEYRDRSDAERYEARLAEAQAVLDEKGWRAPSAEMLPNAPARPALARRQAG